VARRDEARRGRDYTLFDKTRLVLTAGALTRLSGDREYGVNATLQARFSRGLPWQIDGEQVTRTFHFYSGAKLMYHVKKSGDSVTGTAVKES
jgi:ribosomal protein L35AE/L33A